MKKIKLLLVLLTIAATTFYSCTDNSPVENEVVTTKSIALRTTLNGFKKAASITGKTSLQMQDVALCFNFVYPITLSYNNGTQVTVANFQGLIEILTNESSVLYIEGIAFPFQVTGGGVITTLHDEAEFYAYIQQCDYYDVNDFVFDFTCYSIVFPISIINANNETVVVNNQTELLQYVNTPTGNSTYELNIVFPISVVQNNQTIVIHDLYEFYHLNNECGASNCICTQEYAPVCVQTANGIVEYSNACHAACAGFTSADFVNCNPSTACSITNLSATVGACNSDGSYPLTLNFASANPNITEFEVHSGSALVGTYPLAQLPVTVNLTGTNSTISVNIVGNTACSASQTFTPPNCNTTPANFGTGLGSCFSVAYPAQVMSGGALVTVHNDGELLQYYFPATSSIPAFVYPVVVTFTSATGATTIVINNQAAFEAAISSHCN